MQILTFALTLRRMGALPRVLHLIARLGGSVSYISAADGRTNLVICAPPVSAHRFAPQLRRIVDVVDLTELRVVESAGDAEAAEAAARRRPA
jgi:hypothetical protein